jgi:hypothetical protein
MEKTIMKKLKLRKKEKQLEMSDYQHGIERFKTFMQMNGLEVNKKTENEKELFLFMGGFYAACEYKKEK